ncbi:MULTISPECIES: hypothetical protein [Pseudoalteromonas]|uniref:hypothetical protein n=1 Tax=Pseudoalteromonas TaxID=53246 RepID=UPI0015830088|nr:MULTISPECIES: hypothetical protein [Pseudoalteromonas]MDI4653143.1 hypothetical protein [Pseudoalteromonas shioyasakiensis]NUJ39153.1 hypothetical protein [Pseudoalteromonas sp. 0303]
MKFKLQLFRPPQKIEKIDAFKQELIDSGSSAESKTLDETIIDAHFLEYMSYPISSSYKDVFLSSIKGLVKNDYLSPSINWREAVHRLDCFGWEDVRNDILTYFTSNVQGRLFPTTGSSKEMELHFVGHLGYCHIGNNRLVAAKAWLTHKYKDEAQLLNIDCTIRELYPEYKLILEQSLKQESKLSLGYSDRWGILYNNRDIKNIMRIDIKESGTKFYEVSGSKPTEIKGLINKWLCRLVTYNLLNKNFIKLILK